MDWSFGGRRPAWVFRTLLVVVILFTPALAAGQDPVKSFDQLNTRLNPGDTVWVTDAQGREVKGRITSFAPDSMGIDGDGARTFKAVEVRLVENRRHDSLANGTLVGLAAGFGVGAGLTYAACSGDECSWGGAAALVLLVTGAGAGVGAGVDAAMPGRRQVVYRAGGGAGSTRLSLAPVITPGTKGVAVAFVF